MSTPAPYERIVSQEASERAHRRRPSRARRRLLAAGVVVGVLGGCVAVFLLILTRPLRSPPLTFYGVETVRVGTLEESVTLTGSVHLAESKTVPSPEEGLVDAVYVKEGDVVRAGDPIARISSRSLEEAIRDTGYALEQKRREYDAYRAEQSLSAAMTERAIQRARNATVEAARAAQHLRDLATLGAATWESVRAAEAQAQSADGDLADRKDQAALEELRRSNRMAVLEADIRMLEDEMAGHKRDLGSCTILSPADGTVLGVEAEGGAYVRRYEPVAVVADSSRPVIVAGLPDRYLKSVTPGFPASVQVGEHRIPAQVTAIGTQVRAETSGYGPVLDMEVRLEQPPERLVEGMPATVTLVLSKRMDTLMVRRGPFFGTNQERYVFKVVDHTAVRTEVRFGLVTQSEVEVLEGLRAGDRIVVSEYTEFIHQEEVPLGSTEGGVK